MFRKQLTNDFATFNMIQYLMQISPLEPHRYIIDLRKATLQICSPQLQLSEEGCHSPNMNPELTMSISAHLEHQCNLPFRLSPNIVQFLQPSGQADSLWRNASQPYTASMISTGHAIYWCRNNLMALIRALLRDYFVIWHKFQINNYHNKDMYPVDLENGVLEKWLSAATEQIYNRISGCVLIGLLRV